MSFLDKLVAAVTPLESDEDRQAARAHATNLAKPGDWLSHVLEHHRRIEACFELSLNAATKAERQAALRDLSMLLTAHANAEEAMLYPAMANNHEKAHAGQSFEEHAMTRIQLGILETVDPMSQEWRDKLEHIRGAVVHHVYVEEGERFPELREAIAPAEDQRLTTRFIEEFERYMGKNAFDAPRQMATQIDDSNRAPSANWGAADF